MRISIIGTRGLPPSYGGYETFADELVKHMAPMGHEITVACERPTDESTMAENYFGAKLIYFPLKPPKSYGLRKIYEVMNDVYFYFRLAWSTDVMYILAGLGTQSLLLLRLLRPSLRIVTNNDGIEWERSKYSWLEKKIWKSFIRSSMRASHLIIHDNSRLQEHFPPIGANRSITAEYGVRIPEKIPWGGENLQEIMYRAPDLSSIGPGEYFLVIARLQPDNHTHNIIRSFLFSKSKKSLIIVGGPSDSGYLDFLNQIIPEDEKKRVILTGGIYDQKIVEMLRQNCFAYIHGHSAGGTNPSLLEAMASSCAIFAHNNPFNTDVLGNNNLSFSSDSELSEKINSAEKGDFDLYTIGEKNSSRAAKRFTWERCFDRHDIAFMALKNN